jgi:histidinol-phosphate/aromatic aminotransferase/cobyric acid decarboxylase-like protein
VDEAYVEFSGLGMSQVGLIKKFKNVIITRTLSKAYGLAGMRFGYAMADRDVIGQISASLLPWNVGTIPMWAALAAFEDKEAVAERIKFNNQEVDYITKSLGDIPGFVTFPSKANYILFDCGATGKKGKEVVAFAESRGIILRPEAEKYGSDGWFRVTIGTKEENRMFADLIHEFFGMKKLV